MVKFSTFDLTREGTRWLWCGVVPHAVEGIMDNEEKDVPGSSYSDIVLAITKLRKELRADLRQELKKSLKKNLRGLKQGFKKDLRELKQELRDVRGELDAIGSGQYDLRERLNRLETDAVWSRTVGRATAYPDQPSYAPTGNHLIEPEDSWVLEHPYRR